MSALPLAGVTVLDFTRVYSGPCATLRLSDLGADVIKIEHPIGGDDSRAFGPFIAGTSGYFETLNRGKRSVAIDYRVSAGQALVQELVRQADVLIENFRPGQMKRYNLDYASFSAIQPRLIYVSITGFGCDNPQGCYDIVAQAMSGLMSLTGFPNQPVKTGPAIADAISGLTAANGLLAALFRRERTGQGAHVEVAMIDAVFACLENALADFDVTRQVPLRCGNTDRVVAPFDCFRTTDGWIVIAAGNDRLWRSLARLIDEGLMVDPRFATNLRRVENNAALHSILAAWCQARSTQALLAELHAAGVPAGPVRNIAELAIDPRLEARGMLASVEVAEGVRLKVPGSPVHFEDVAVQPAQRGPRLGEHTRSILSDWLALSAAEMDRLQAEGVIA
ncbi:MAG TPA: CoA transferase [Anaerolineae bacterium]|nr:CoA transferase [Anaerolineae bacterium]